MDDGFEILIYILFIVVSILGGLYKNYAKRKEEEARRLKRQQADGEYTESQSSNREREFQSEFEERSQQEPQRPVTNPFEEFLRQQMEIIEEPVPEPPEEVVLSESQENKLNLDSVGIEGAAVFESTANELLSDNMQEQDFSITNSIESIESLGEVYNYDYNKITDNEISDIESVIEEFDGKKAIIYAEILKRPDF